MRVDAIAQGTRGAFLIWMMRGPCGLAEDIPATRGAGGATVVASGGGGDPWRLDICLLVSLASATAVQPGLRLKRQAGGSAGFSVQ